MQLLTKNAVFVGETRPKHAVICWSTVRMYCRPFGRPRTGPSQSCRLSTTSFSTYFHSFCYGFIWFQVSKHAKNGFQLPLLGGHDLSLNSGIMLPGIPRAWFRTAKLPEPHEEVASRQGVNHRGWARGTWKGMFLEWKLQTCLQTVAFLMLIDAITGFY